MDDLVVGESLDNLWSMWFSELYKKRAGLTFRVNRVLYSGDSDFQRIDVLETEEFGKVLVLYGSVMCTDSDEFIYHEMISHPALHVHPNPKEVLLIGGGDGGTLREVMKHKRVQRATMVEIDKKVCEICEEFFPHIATDFKNPRANLVFDDGAAFVAKAEEKYDLIIADVSDPVGPAQTVFQKPFHQNIYDILNDDGIFIAQTESPYYHDDVVRKLYKNLNQIFPIVRMFLAFIPTYPSGMWSFAFCSKKYDPLLDLQAFENIEGLRYYNSEIHRGAFALPNFVRDLTEEM